MWQRRIQLVVLMAILAGSVITTTEAGPRRRCCPPVYVEPPKIVLSTCPVYKWLDNGAFGHWYAIQCDNKSPAQPIGPPINYDAAGGITATYPCTNGIPGQPISSAAPLPKSGIHGDLREGYAGPIVKRKPIPRAGKANIKVGPNGEELTVDFQIREIVNRHVRIPGTTRQVHIVRALTKIISPLPPELQYMREVIANVAYEIHEEANPEDPASVTAHSDPTFTGVLMINYNGEVYPAVMKR